MCYPQKRMEKNFISHWSRKTTSASSSFLNYLAVLNPFQSAIMLLFVTGPRRNSNALSSRQVRTALSRAHPFENKRKTFPITQHHLTERSSLKNFTRSSFVVKCWKWITRKNKEKQRSLLGCKVILLNPYK